MIRFAAVTSAVLLLSACGGKIATPKGQECSEGLRQAEAEYEKVSSESLSSGIEMAKAANLLSQAAVARQFEKFDACIDKVRRARIYIQEARKK